MGTWCPRNGGRVVSPFTASFLAALASPLVLPGLRSSGRSVTAEASSSHHGASPGWWAFLGHMPTALSCTMFPASWGPWAAGLGSLEFWKLLLPSQWERDTIPWTLAPTLLWTPHLCTQLESGQEHTLPRAAHRELTPASLMFLPLQTHLDAPTFQGVPIHWADGLRQLF